MMQKFYQQMHFQAVNHGIMVDDEPFLQPPVCANLLTKISLFIWVVCSVCFLFCSPRQEISVELEQLPIEKIAQGDWYRQDSSTAIKKIAYRLLSNQNDFSAFWKNFFVKTIPEVDFKKHFVIGIFQGLKKTGGYGIDVAGVYFDNKKNLIQVMLIISEPGPDQAVDLVETSPYVIIKVNLPSSINDSLKVNNMNIKFIEQTDSSQIPIEVSPLLDE